MIFDIENHKALPGTTDKRGISNGLIDWLEIFDIEVARLVAKVCQIV